MSSKKSPLANPYGYFDAAAREYVITRPDTPTPWFNFIGEGRYGGIVSNAAGGYAFDRDPREPARVPLSLQRDPGRPARPLRLPPRHGDGQVLEPDLAADAARRTLRAYECRHGAGYTRISRDLRRDRGEPALLRPALPGRGELPRARCGC